jgi:MinD-like ATPase involved in chromosome partitioning or flagellar assembly
MNTLSMTDRLLTWLDIERVLKEQTQLWSHLPEGVHWVDCFADGMEVAHSCQPQDVLTWLSEIFGKTINTKLMHITLRAGGGLYAVRLEQVADTPAKKLPVYPLWRDMVYLKATPQTPATTTAATPSALVMPLAYTEGPKIVSFHSFKGGVGRTTAMMTYVAAQLQSSGAAPIKLLVVDADLEAPGVSFWLDAVNQPQVSFVQFLEALHYPPVSTAASLQFFADELRKTSLNVGGAHRELFVLPAALDLAEIQDMPVQPGHLARNPTNPWVLTDYLHALGKLLGVDAVFVDLRAGLSELSSPLIFDPRVEHYFVTTVAKQSVTGTVAALERLHAFNSALPLQAQRNAKPTVVVSLLTPDLRKMPEYEIAKEAIERAYPPVSDGLNDGLEEGVEWLEAGFSAPLMSINSVSEAFDRLKLSTLYANAQGWSSKLEAASITATAPRKGMPTKVSDKSDVKKLYAVCERVQFAESNEFDAMLVTEPLRNLGKHFSATLPNVVLTGAKGAGKTFTFRQVCKAKTWHDFLKLVDEQQSTSALNAMIFPVLWSQSLGEDAKKTLVAVQTGCLKVVDNGASSVRQSELLDAIVEALDKPTTQWASFWDQLICKSFGVKGRDLKALNQKFIQSGQSVVLVFDGLEDAFSNPTSEPQQKAIESLLKLTNRLSELDDQKIGALIFVRIDYVQAAIKQNAGQFLSRFTPFQLTWNPESFLRLAYWICAQAHIINASADTAETLSVDGLIAALEALWGKKLGQPTSKEGLSARWVYSALCDLKGNFQARDLVRFLKFAADFERNSQGDAWGDRLLAPESIRKAIPKCSIEKVEEASAEIAPLKAWKKRMAEKKSKARRTPFSAKAMHLLPDELAALKELGVIYEDSDSKLGDDRLFLPEIYRKGLSFDSSSGRPKIQALLKKNLGVMPF